jgi:hypothetical protein
MVMPAGDHDRIRCFNDQVKLTHALVRDHDKAINEVKLLGEHEEESSQKIMVLEALCKRLREDAQKLKEENTKLEGVVESRDGLIMEIAKEIGLDRMREDAEAEDEDDDNRGDDTTPPGAVAPPPAPMPLATTVPEEVLMEDPVEMVSEQQAPVAHEVILGNVDPELPLPHLYRMLMRDYEESPLRMIDDLDDLDDLTKASSDMNEWFPEDGSISHQVYVLSLGLQKSLYESFS